MSISYATRLEAWVDKYSPDYSLHTRNPIEQLLACEKAQCNYAALAVAQNALQVVHVQ